MVLIFDKSFVFFLIRTQVSCLKFFLHSFTYIYIPSTSFYILPSHSLIMSHQINSNSPSPPPPNQLSIIPGAIIKSSLKHVSHRQVSSSARNHAHPYSSKSTRSTLSRADDFNSNKILSPALSQPSNSNASILPHLTNAWDNWARILANEVYGPFRIPVTKLKMKNFSRNHSSCDVISLIDAIAEDDQRSLHPILVEIYPGVITESKFKSLFPKLKVLDDFPQELLQGSDAVAFIIHGAKRFLACHGLEDGFIYAKFLKPGAVVSYYLSDN